MVLYQLNPSFINLWVEALISYLGFKEKCVREWCVQLEAHLGVSTNFSTNMLSSLKDFNDSLLADSRAELKSSGLSTILIP